MDNQLDVFYFIEDIFNLKISNLSQVLIYLFLNKNNYKILANSLFSYAIFPVLINSIKPGKKVRIYF